MRVWLAGIAALVACGNSGSPPQTACRALDASTQVGVTHGTLKIRDDSPLPATTAVDLDAARNEFEPFQIVIAGGTGGITDLHVTKTALVRDGDPTITLPAADITLYQEARTHVLYASSTEGATGYWPDPLIPDVDPYLGQARNAFVHFDVPANVTRAVWVDVRVPADQPAGFYTGTFTVEGTGLAATAVSVHLRVRNFALPATATLKSAFGMSVDEVTRAHFGGQWCSDFPIDQTNGLLLKYASAALDHRITLMSPTCGNPTSNLAQFDQWQGPLYNGTAMTQLAGARATSFRNPDVGGMSSLEQHFTSKGWSGLMDYSCDEPPRACDLANWPARAQAAHASGIPNLVTTELDYLQQQGWLDLVDIACPVAETMNDTARAAWDTFLARGATKQLWWYQSCDSHGCGGCDASNGTFDGVHGMPSYVIDSDARQNRAMEWLSFIYDVSGELYYEAVQNLAAGLDWDSGLAYCAFGGNGDGSLFYPGKPGDARIGGPAGSDFPMESVRLQLIREGMEDYEYLALYAQKFGRDAAVAKAKQVFPDVFGAKAHPADLLYQVRRELADGIEGLAPSELDVPRAAGAIDLGGDLHEFAAATPVVVATGAGNATFRMVWDGDALYVAATVSDVDLRAQGTGKDGPLYNADSVEILIDPLHALSIAPTQDDRQIIASAKGDVYDARGVGAAGDPSFDLAGLEVHAIAHGTFDDATPDQGYQIVARIPWAALGITDAVSAGRELGVDLALDDLDATGLSTADWAGLLPFAQPSRWHAIRLVGAGCP